MRVEISIIEGIIDDFREIDVVAESQEDWFKLCDYFHLLSPCHCSLNTIDGRLTIRAHNLRQKK